MFEVMFLIVLAGIWILVATIQDLRTREVANWLNFSLIIFALSFRLIFSIFSQDNFNFFIQGIFWLGIFFVLGNLLYYLKVFAGGDAKLLIALGAVIPFNLSFSENFELAITFLALLFAIGAVYGLLWAITLTIKNIRSVKKGIKKQLTKSKKLILFSVAITIVLLILGILSYIFLLFAAIVFLLPFLYIYSKSVDDICMVKKISSRDLREGDWLYRDISLGKQKIKARWEGLSKKEIRQIRKSKKFVLIRQGIPFVPSFLIAFLIFVLTYLEGFSIIREILMRA